MGFTRGAFSARRAGALLVVVSCVVLVAADSGSSAGSASALVVQQGGQLYALAVDGSRRVRLTRTPVRGTDTTVSPDGSTVAFARDGGISTMRLDGSGQRIVTRDGGVSPAWTSDGQTIYFVRYRTSRFGEPCGSIFSVSASGGGVRRITNSGEHSHEDPAVSPDGRRIAFSDWDQCAGGTASPRLRVVDPSGKKTQDLALLPRNGYYPAPEHSSPYWSPDGTRLAYRWNAELAVANRDGSGQRRLTRGSRTLIYEAPAWSPDGNWIAFTRQNLAGLSTLIVVHPDGTGLRRLGASKAAYTLAGWLRSMPR